MALGGGNWVTQNKVLPGTYINTISRIAIQPNFSDRGIVAIPFELSWGIDGDIFTVENTDFQKYTLKLFGKDYADDSMKNLRELFLHAKTAHIYKLNQNGAKASNNFAVAKYFGTVGNNVKIEIKLNANYTAVNQIYDVITYLYVEIIENGVVTGNYTKEVDLQTIKLSSELKSNDYVEFKSFIISGVVAPTSLAGGTDGTITNADYQTFLDKAENKYFNVLACTSNNVTIKQLFNSYTKRLRNELGINFQLVTHQELSDFEGTISILNTVDSTGIDLIYWTAGACASAEINESLTGFIYDGEYTIDTDYTQAQLIDYANQGYFIFHSVSNQVQVLLDNNSFISVTDVKSNVFRKNQTIRILDQISTDIPVIFNKQYLGKTPNDDIGRASLKATIVNYLLELERLRAIENFTADDVTVDIGSNKNDVLITINLQIINNMEKAYMTIYIL